MKTFIATFSMTWRTLLARKVRSFLTILGVVIGVAGVIIIISLGAGAQSLVLGQITKLGSNLVGVLPGKSNDSGPPAAVFGVQIKTLTLSDVAAIRDIGNAPNVTDVAAFVRGNTTVIGNGESIDTSFTATDGSYPRVQNVEMESGEFFSDDQANSGANVIVLGYDVATAIFPNGGAIGNIVKIKSSGNSGGSIPFRVIGIQKKMGTVAFQNQDDQVFIPFSIGQRQILGIDYVQFIRAKVNDTANVKSTISDIQNTLRRQHRIGGNDDDDFSVRDLADAIKVLTSITDVLRMFLGLMAGISLIVGGIGIMNIMLVTVTERTREIGLRKALGATRKQIQNQFLFEAIILTSLGGLVGIVFGSIVSFLISIGAQYAGYDWSFIISPFAIIISVGVSVLIGLIFGIFPALKAAKLDPIDALRYE
ncbi:MAG: ABC transporter permease [Candidatus Nomurabacteria bacterium]|nr:ABC transporter permease [Candidatus Nomurabacteria bacterium]